MKRMLICILLVIAGLSVAGTQSVQAAPPQARSVGDVCTGLLTSHTGRQDADDPWVNTWDLNIDYKFCHSFNDLEYEWRVFGARYHFHRSGDAGCTRVPWPALVYVDSYEMATGYLGAWNVPNVDWPCQGNGDYWSQKDAPGTYQQIGPSADHCFGGTVKEDLRPGVNDEEWTLPTRCLPTNF
jgi:hypothetical protein